MYEVENLAQKEDSVTQSGSVELLSLMQNCWICFAPCLSEQTQMHG